MASRILALSEAPPQTLVRVVAVRAGFGMSRHLADMGIVPGQRIRVLENSQAGPILVQIGDARLELSRGWAKHILVEYAEPGESGRIKGRRTLCELMPGQQATIVGVKGDGAIRQRLLDMGLTRGTSVRVERYAPLGDPIQVMVKGYQLAIRRQEARYVEIEL